MHKPTKKQTALLAFIEGFTAEQGFSPSYREIMRGMSLNSVSAVAEHVENCVAAGYLKRVPGAARSLEIIKPVDVGQIIGELERLVAEEKFSPAALKILQGTIQILNDLDTGASSA